MRLGLGDAAALPWFHGQLRMRGACIALEALPGSGRAAVASGRCVGRLVRWEVSRGGHSAARPCASAGLHAPDRERLIKCPR